MPTAQRPSTPTRRRRQQRQRALTAAGAAIVVVAGPIGLAVAARGGDDARSEVDTLAGPAPVAGRPSGVTELPDLEFTRFHSGEADRLGDYRGRPLVINFWASWCTPCLAELPRFEQTYQAHKDEVEFLGLNLQDSIPSAAKVVAETGLNYPLGIDPDGRLFQSLGGFGMPTTLFVAADGTVLERHTGELSAEELTDRLQAHGMVGSGA